MTFAITSQCDSSGSALNSKHRVHRVTQRVALAMVVALSWTVGQADAQVYEPGSTVLGKTIGDWSKDYIGLRWANDPAQIATKTQPGPVFFISFKPGGDIEVNVPAGAPIFSAFGSYATWDKGGLSGNQAIARTARSDVRPSAFQIDNLSIPSAELSRYWEEVSTPFLWNGDPNGWQAGYMLMMDPLATGEHQLHQQTNLSGSLFTLNAKINVFELDAESLDVGQTYTQSFDSLGSDGIEGMALPHAWTVTDENAFNIYQHDTAASFPITSTARGTYPFAMSAGVPGETDRALAIYGLRDSDVCSPTSFGSCNSKQDSSKSRLQFLADANGGADSLQVQFDIEAWDASTSSTASSPGEAAFDVTIDIDSGNGFQPLLDLGRVTTGELQKPTGDYLNGNDAANRIRFDSGVLPAAIPDGSQLRLRWSTDLNANSDGWVFGIDNFAITLLGNVGGLAGDFNGDGLLDINDLNTLSTAIQINAGDMQYDLDQSGVVDLADRQYWVSDVKKTWLGDTNLDGVFDSGDMVSVFLAGEYEDAIGGNSTWATGDWNGDGDFNSGDMISAFLDGGYEAGPRAAVSAVPEPSTILLTAIALLGLVRFRER